MVRFLDFRSDTVTKPSPAMRTAMAEAEVGDDVMGEDRTVNQLEAVMAKRLGFEAALFVPSGTMANQIAIWVHTQRAGQVVCEQNSHIALYEGGAAALLSGATVRTVVGHDGVFGPDDLEPHVFPDDPHFAPTKMVCVENTHNWSGGNCWSAKQTDALAEAAHNAGAALHVDGARIFNAEVATGTKASKLLASADSVMTCLSKGLGAPVGSVLCGSAPFIHQARRVRKALGGGMRQAGMLAAAGLVALDNVARLQDDHALAAILAKKLARLDMPAQTPATNMVLVDVAKTGMTGAQFCEVAGDIGVGLLPIDAGTKVRFVTHLDVGPADVDEAVERLAQLLA